MRSGRAIATYDTSGLARGLESFGNSIASIGEKRQDQQNALDITRAEAYKTEGLLNVQNEFDNDPEYATYEKRAPVKTGDVITKAGNLIRDPKKRELWLARAQSDGARVNDGIFDKGVQTQKAAEVIAFDDALEVNRRLYVDPNTSEEVKAKAKGDIEASISMAQEVGLLDPVTAEARRKAFVEDAEFSRGKLAVEQDPNVVTAHTISPEIPAEGAAFLDAMSGPESGGKYNVIYGGKSFSSFADHPRVAVPIPVGPNTGKTSSAAGRYQFIGSTWDRAAKATGVKDFSPASQDKAAWWLAQNDYKANTGRDLLTDLKSKDPATIAGVRKALAPTWESLGSTSDAQFTARVAAGARDNPAWFKALSPEQQAVITQQASAQQQKNDVLANAQATAARTSRKDDYSLRISTHDATLTPQEILADPIIDNGDKASLISTLETKNKDANETAAAISAFSQGALNPDPYDTKGVGLVDKAYDELAKNVPPESIQPLAEEMVRQSGVVPQAALNVIRGGLAGTDEAGAMAALQAARRISAIDPAALARRSGGSDVQSAADDFNFYVDRLNMTPEAATKRIMAANDPQKKRDRKALEPLAKDFVKSMESFDIADSFDTYFGMEPALGFNPSQAAGMKAELLAMAEEQFYAANGDPAIAKNRATEEFKRLYGVSEIAKIKNVRVHEDGNSYATYDKVVMRHPPENYWPKAPTSLWSGADPFGYAKDQILTDIAVSLGHGTPSTSASAMHDVKNTKGSLPFDPSTIQMIATRETEAMIKRGEMPGYSILWTDNNGVIQTIPGKLWRPNFNSVNAVNAKDKQNAIDAARQKDADLKAGYNREQTLDTFLEATPESILGGGN